MTTKAKVLMTAGAVLEVAGIEMVLWVMTLSSSHQWGLFEANLLVWGIIFSTGAWVLCVIGYEP